MIILRVANPMRVGEVVHKFVHDHRGQVHNVFFRVEKVCTFDEWLECMAGFGRDVRNIPQSFQADLFYGVKILD